jgi:hypothetical protein
LCLITLFILLFRKENIFTDYIICTFAHFRQHEPPSTEVVAKGVGVTVSMDILMIIYHELKTILWCLRLLTASKFISELFKSCFHCC